jgi:hypothetical protein
VASPRSIERPARVQGLTQRVCRVPRSAVLARAKLQMNRIVGPQSNANYVAQVAGARAAARTVACNRRVDNRYPFPHIGLRNLWNDPAPKHRNAAMESSPPPVRHPHDAPIQAGGPARWKRRQAVSQPLDQQLAQACETAETVLLPVSGR